jgi:hypothetical protein
MMVVTVGCTPTATRKEEATIPFIFIRERASVLTLSVHV